MRTKAEVVADLKGMLADMLTARDAGQTHARLARAHGYVDGYMRALMDLDVLTKGELLALVGGERARTSGPAVRVLGSAEDESSTVVDGTRAA